METRFMYSAYIHRDVSSVTQSNKFHQLTIGGNALLLHWAVIYHDITGHLPAIGALKNLYNPACTYTHLQDNTADQLVFVA